MTGNLTDMTNVKTDQQWLLQFILSLIQNI